MTAGVAAGPRYTGRFAPSPTGPLHAGSLVAALASWLDARAHQGRWLVRIEDVDTPRCVDGAGEFILRQLATCGLVPDAPPVWQSTRGALYQRALDQLIAQHHAYPCACSRKDIEEAQAALGHARERHAALPYPGTCRHGLHGRTGRSWRFNATEFQPDQAPAHTDQTRAATYSIASGILDWQDRRLGTQRQDVAHAVGDFVLRRADGLWAYQLAVVVDDADQGMTHVVRGEDLADNTPRQILLQQALGVPTPRYLHTPLVCGENGEKLSKQNGARALELAVPLQALAGAAQVLGLPPLTDPNTRCISDALTLWVAAWRRNYNVAP
ncbi:MULTISPECIES: tRNA glutamyl-Q(34) synthetase GluQRS [unclassified Acidovorax]|uniref:tRNA glutamyl-Q(34) synthetase GluQRS n=1 Tax=unclassified Acidovorax TaxID=2684926 RepID=UPI001C48EAB9|nr:MULTISPECIES: tRNA glutamyl-Q(34) synthetase GluQRS [unclassified Acidovorax]MBV7426854.1 tRNA glutamyl-Q(34) synthetase GluQRS [Acidovorax sp. sif0732]MBV7447979.1 tRNA glutamyl-Q(34) synthetase GluQRS [Acidovorax sp. sif0715]